MNAIETESLTRLYGRRVGIQDLGLSIPEGTVFGFLGPNGAGKTTTIRVLLGFLRPTGGAARVFGRDCWRLSHRIKREVGYIPGDLRLYAWMSGTDALRIFGAARRRDLLRDGRALAERFSLDLRVKVRNMSRGMRQKLGLIVAMAHRPRLLILDEPSSGLDPLMQESLRRYIRRLSAAGHTVFFSSHTLSEVEQVCDRIAIVREGRLVADASLEELRARASRKVTITWKKESDAEKPVPPCLEVGARRDRQWTCTLTSPVSDLLQWAAREPIEDLSVGQADLESLFRSYYAKGTEEP